MPTYAIGDIHGCIATLECLLEQCGYRAGEDRLWLVGDLVNRGPASAAVLRWARSQGERLIAVLGNHDLHLLACAAGVRRNRGQDTFDDVLEAGDCDELIDWLRCRPLVHREGRYTLVHAGVPPKWNLRDLPARVVDLEAALQGPAWKAEIETLYRGVTPVAWRDDMGRTRRKRFTLAALTRMRMCTPKGRLQLRYSGPPERAPRGLQPWFAWRAPDATPEDLVIFGHWAALGRQLLSGVWALDSGVAWGGSLTAIRLEDGEVFEVPCLDAVSNRYE